MWKKKYNRYILFLILLTPFWMWLSWLLSPKKPLMIAVVDKTVLTQQGQEHISLMWVLNQEKYVKRNNERYRPESDYFGFFPLADKKFKLKGLERFSSAQIQQLANDCDMAYITDAYGIYNNEWFRRSEVAERSGIVYGGMSQQDLAFLQEMKARKKLIVTEFNCLGSPTAPAVRSNFETTFAMRWTGWIGRFFDVLDTAKNKELPGWLIRNYMQQHDGKWPFRKSGVAFVRDDDRVEILEQETHLTYAIPRMVFTAAAQKEYHLPESIDYSFWFDVCSTDTAVNKIAGNFQLAVNKAGAQVLQGAGIPQQFPAVMYHKASDYQFWYFSADFCDNPISLNTSYFKGIGFFRRMFYNTTDPADRKRFFWNVYRPLVTTILKDYQHSLQQ